MTDLRREIFVALISPIGIDLNAVEASLKQAFRSIDYKTNNIRLTDFFNDKKEWFNLDYKGEFERYSKYIKAGDDLCRFLGRRDVLALYGMTRLQGKYPNRENELPGNVAHIFRQVKRVEEIEAFRVRTH